MLKKIPFAAAALVLLGVTLAFVRLVPSQTPPEPSADPADELEQARSCYQIGDYQTAEQIYQSILQNHPGSDYAFQAQKHLTIVYIAWDKPAQAEAAYQQLLANFAGNAQMPAAEIW